METNICRPKRVYSAIRQGPVFLEYQLGLCTVTLHLEGQVCSTTITVRLLNLHLLQLTRLVKAKKQKNEQVKIKVEYKNEKGN